MIGNKTKNCKGITLIEIMISLAIFAIVLVGVVNLFISLLKKQKDLMDRAYVLNSLSYTMEYMSKSIRMAQKDLTGSCIAPGKNFEQVGSSLRFKSYNDECQEFFLDSKILKVSKNNVVHNLTPSNILVDELNFAVVGEVQTDDTQPKVSFSMKAKAQNGQISPLFIQTTVSQRMLDINY